MNAGIAQDLQNLGVSQEAITTLDQFFQREGISWPDEVRTLQWLAKVAPQGGVMQLNQDPLAMARRAHWEIMTPEQQAQEPQPGKGTPLDFLAQQVGSLFGGIGSLFETEQSGQKFGQNQSNTPNLDAAAQKISASPATAGKPDPTSIDPSNARDLHGQPYGPPLGAEPPNMVGSWAQAWQMPDTTSQDEQDFQAVAGDSAKAGYQVYLKNWQISHQMEPNRGQQQPIPFNQWAAQHIQAAYGPALQVIQDLGVAYRLKTGRDMPAALRQQILQRFVNDPASSVELAAVKAALDQALQSAAYSDSANAASGVPGTNPSTGAAILKGGAYANLLDVLDANTTIGKMIPWLPAMITTYDQVNPSQTDLEANAKLGVLSAWQAAFPGTAPSAADYAALKGKTASEIQTYINQQKMSNGMQYGAYQDSKNRLDPLWQQYLNREMTPDEIARFASQSGEEVSSWINQQPSHHDGLNVGQYQSYSATMDNLSTKYFGSSQPDLLDRMLKANAGKPTP